MSAISASTSISSDGVASLLCFAVVGAVAINERVYVMVMGVRG
ncbi:MAG: hypothetical protein ABI417_11365 [Coleofasciculaceae cyanobacterium]